jgi:phytoene dehydrogenase-like protein
VAKASVVVVGGGLSGLAASATMARAGLGVTLLEKAAVAGGRARSRTAGGFVFNVGPHALYDGPARAYLRELGVPFTGGYRPGGHLVRGGRLHTLPSGPWSLLSTGLLGLAGRFEAARFLSGLGRLDPSPFAATSWADWLREHVAHADVRDMLSAFVRVATYSNDPERSSAGAALAQLQQALRGVLYLDGGWQTLVDGLLARAREAGVDIRTRTAVGGVEAGPWPEVRLADGARLRADAVLIAADPALAARFVPASAVLAGASAAAIPVRTATLDLALRRLPRPDRTFALGVDRPLYFSVHSSAARLAASGGALVHAAMYLGDGTRLDPRGIEAELSAFVERLQPGFARETVIRRFVPDLVVSHALVSAKGNGLAGRPDVAVPDAPGVFVAGDWVGPEGQLADASLASARQAAKAIRARVASRRAA